MCSFSRCVFSHKADSSKPGFCPCGTSLCSVHMKRALSSPGWKTLESWQSIQRHKEEQGILPALCLCTQTSNTLTVHLTIPPRPPKSALRQRELSVLSLRCCKLPSAFQEGGKFRKAGKLT